MRDQILLSSTDKRLFIYVDESKRAVTIPWNVDDVCGFLRTFLSGCRFREDGYAAYELFRRHDGSRVCGPACWLENDQSYNFEPSQFISPKCGGEWDSTMLTQLGYYFETATFSKFCEALGIEHPAALSAAVAQVEAETAGLDLDAFDLERQTQSSHKEVDVRFQRPLWKAVYFSDKHMHHDPLVDSFVFLLLQQMGFLSEYLFPIFHWRLSKQLPFGTHRAEFEDAVADLVVTDIATGSCRMCVMEDKNVGCERPSTEPQLVAAAIAMQHNNTTSKEHQPGTFVSSRKHAQSAEVTAAEELGPRQKQIHNTFAGHVAMPSAAAMESAPEVACTATCDPADPEEPVVGIRVNGFIFQFYVIHVSSAVLQAMQSKRAAAPWATPILKSKQFNFLRTEERKIILMFLDVVLDYVLKLSRLCQ